MPRDKLIKSFIVKCRLYTAFHLLNFFSGRTLQRVMGQILSQWQLLPSCYQAVTQLRYQHCPWECWEWTKQQHANISTPRACKQKQKPPGRWVRYLQRSGNSTQHLCSHATAPDEGQAKKFGVSNFHLSGEHCVRIVNVHFGTHSSENTQEDFHKAGQFCQVCEATHGVLLSGDPSRTETSTGSGPRPLHGGLLWWLPKI